MLEYIKLEYMVQEFDINNMGLKAHRVIKLFVDFCSAAVKSPSPLHVGDSPTLSRSPNSSDML